MVGADRAQLAAVGLDFFELLGHGVVAVRTSAHLERLVDALQAYFRFVPGAAARAHQPMAFDALQGRGRGREAQVQIPLPGGELAEGAHGDGAVHA
ncbi:hypothetical protein D3C79_868480 [compost metagenome]